ALAVQKGEQVCTNEDLIRNAAWCWSPMTAEEIHLKTGIAQRLYTDLDLDHLALMAARQALEKSGRRPEEIGAVVFCSCTSAKMMPSVATWLSGQLGIFQTHASCDIVAASVPAVFVVQHHRLSQQRFQLGHGVMALDDVLPRIPGVVRVVGEERPRQVARVGERLGDGGLDRGKLSAGPFPVAEDVEEDAKDLVLDALVPGRAERAIARVDRGAELAHVRGLEHRQEHLVAEARHVAPARRALLVERD